MILSLEYEANRNIFGPEDGSVGKKIVKWCDDVVYIPTIGCMNLAATANVVLYDRMAKLGAYDDSALLIKQSRDNNNRVKIKK